MLVPKGCWFWFYDQAHDALCLDMGDMVFATPYNHSKLAESTDVFRTEKSAFSVEDTALYTYFYQVASEELGLAEPLCVQIALNAVASATYCKPVGNKSWLVEMTAENETTPLDNVVTMTSKTQQGIFLKLSGDDNTCCLMLLGSTMTLNNLKALKKFETIQVLNNRVSPYFQSYHTPVARCS